MPSSGTPNKGRSVGPLSQGRMAEWKWFLFMWTFVGLLALFMMDPVDSEASYADAANRRTSSKPARAAVEEKATQAQRSSGKSAAPQQLSKAAGGGQTSEDDDDDDDDDGEEAQRSSGKSAAPQQLSKAADGGQTSEDDDDDDDDDGEEDDDDDSDDKGEMAGSRASVVQLPQDSQDAVQWNRLPASSQQDVQGNRQPSIQAGGRPQVGAVLAVHPPRFYYAARFLERWSRCPSAMAAMSVHVVFTEEQDLRLFRDAQKKLSPHVPADAWTAVICSLPRKVRMSNNQKQAAWKKWYGIAHLLDLGDNAPVYGLMLDSELELYDRDACQPGGEWSRLFSRLQAMEASKTFPAARVGKDLVKYNFRGREMDGFVYDQHLIKENADFALQNVPGRLPGCQTEGCKEVRRQIEKCLFSWWRRDRPDRS
eukprot:TRINITY_DN3157_c0_g1_i1.p1 TRINITY_DN3157_c0_g1~~TRINITY_DN3157_c0_g1_i1.p1  ORF type:complete len:424 (+),score=104.39 TRINITY_DN3157_c0_g1_i1:114-1385(+)